MAWGGNTWCSHKNVHAGRYGQRVARRLQGVRYAGSVARGDLGDLISQLGRRH